MNEKNRPMAPEGGSSRNQVTSSIVNQKVRLQNQSFIFRVENEKIAQMIQRFEEVIV